jgi:hypothetical protein
MNPSLLWPDVENVNTTVQGFNSWHQTLIAQRNPLTKIEGFQWNYQAPFFTTSEFRKQRTQHMAVYPHTIQCVLNILCKLTPRRNIFRKRLDINHYKRICQPKDMELPKTKKKRLTGVYNTQKTKPSTR